LGIFCHALLYDGDVWCIIAAEMRRYLQWCFALLAAGGIAGCSSPQMSRIDSDRGLYESWPLEIKQAVLDGKAEPGMTPDMVRMALGRPTEVVTRAGAPNSGDDEIWIYRRGGEMNDPMMGGYPGGMGGAYPAGMGGGYPAGYPGSTGGGIVISPGRGGGISVIPPSIGIGVPIGGGNIGIGNSGIGIGGGGMGGMGGGMPMPVSRSPVEEREVVFRNGVVYRADPPPE
jgi:hypothetical protein